MQSAPKVALAFFSITTLQKLKQFWDRLSRLAVTSYYWFNDLGETLDFGDSCFLPSKMIIIDHLPKSRVDNGKELSDDRNQLSFGVNHMPFGSSKTKTSGVI